VHARLAFYVVVVVLVANLGALTDLVLHPEIPYFDLEHVVAGGLSGVAVALAFGALEARSRRRLRETEELHESEFLLLESQRAAHIGSYQIDLVLNQWQSSEVLDELFGIGPDYSRTCDGWLALVHPDERSAMARYRRERAAGSQQAFDTEYRIVRKSDGAVRWVHDVAAVTLNAAGVPVAMIGTIQDITERRRAELERKVLLEIESGLATTANLDELLALMHRAVQQVLDARNCFVALYDGRTGRFSFPYFVDQFDEAPEPAALSNTCTAYVYRRGLPALIRQADFDRLQAEGEVALVGAQSPSWMGVPLRTPSGMIGVLVVQHYEQADVYDEQDLRFLASVGDHAALMIERKLAEVALRDSERELNVILNATADGLLAVDADGKVLRTNRRFAEMWKIPPEVLASRDDDQLLGHVLSQLADPEEFLAKVRALYHSSADANDIVLFADGRVFERFTTPILEGDARVGRIWSFRDVTARERAVEAKAALEDRLRHSEKLESVGRLAGGIAHDFNNMLAVIMGMADHALLKVTPSDPLYADLAEIRKAGARSADLTRQLLAYARRETIVPQVLDLNDAVAHLLSMLKRLIGEDIEMRWEPGAALWPVSIDPSQLGNILTNLCVNARQAIADVGTITLASANCVLDDAFCAGHPDAVAGDYVRLSISDTGRGMDAETLKLVFEPFFTTKRLGEGTGLGLSSVYGAVRQNNGFLTVRSVVNEGTEFDIYLPRHTDEHTRPRTSGPRSTVRVGGHETVLVVEDEPSILELTRRVLETQGFTVLTASSARDALELVASHQGAIDLLLTDVIMPEMNGRDLSEKARALRPQLKLLFMSGHPADVIASRGLLNPGVSLVEKPFSIDALLEHVRGELDRA
jgi:PAS domain S-box-containing protein